jgi:hypothetical protein
MYELRARDEFDSLGRTSQEEGGGPPPTTPSHGGPPPRSNNLDQRGQAPLPDLF